MMKNNNNNDDSEHWYEQVPKLVETGPKVKVGNHSMESTSTHCQNNSNNKLDNIIHDGVEGTCMLIHYSILGDRNLIKKEAENILRHKYRTIKIQHMWNVKAKVMPITIGATGTISKLLRKYLSNTLRKHKIKELQITAILDTAYTYCGKY